MHPIMHELAPLVVVPTGVLLVYFMLSNCERDDFWSTFTVFDFGQILTFPEMSLKLIPIPPDGLFIGFKHS